MSPIEIARDTVAALKSSPLLLVVILLNIVMVGAGLLYLRREQAQMDRMIELMSECSKGLPAMPQRPQ
jgi:hypothetical protein